MRNRSLKYLVRKGSEYLVHDVGVIQETAKAYLVCLTCNLDDEPATVEVWVPKVQASVSGTTLTISAWMLSTKLEEIEPMEIATLVLENRLMDDHPPVDSDDPRYVPPVRIPASARRMSDWEDWHELDELPDLR